MRQKNEILGITLGCFTVLLINILLGILMIVFGILAGGLPMSLPKLFPIFILIANLYLLQTVYVIPMLIYLILKKRWFFLIGVIGGALLTWVLNFLLVAFVVSKFIGG